jgi:serine/threonine-protein kinase
MSDASLDSVIEQYLLRAESGEPRDDAQWLARYPQWADDLQEFFSLHHQAQTTFQQPLTDDWAATQLPGQVRLESGTSASNWTWSQIASAQYPIPFGPYDLLAEINRGGMGIVYRAIHRQLQRVVALKILRAGELATAEEVKRFHTEAITSSNLNHPHIVSIFEAGQCHGLIYFTMAYIDGEDLEAKLQREPLDPQLAAHLLLKMAEAVAFAHEHHILHRDIKPSNILIDTQGTPFLADFGLARSQQLDEKLTLTGQILGTPAYMAPEQARASSAMHAESADISALGAVLYAALTGQAPFSGPTPFDILLQVLDRQPPAPTQIQKKIPRPLEAICLKAMAKNPALRYPSAVALAEDLRLFLRGDPINVARPSWRQRFELWWRREPILISHLGAIGATAVIILISFLARYSHASTQQFAVKFGILVSWSIASILLQRLSRFNRRREWVHLLWATADMCFFTAAIIAADPPRGLLFVGYPLMIAVSGLFYRVRFVTFMTTLSCLSTLLVATTVTDSLTDRVDFLSIYLIALVVLGTSIAAMIRRVRSLSRFYGELE